MSKLFGKGWEELDASIRGVLTGLQAIPAPLSHTATEEEQPSVSTIRLQGPTPLPRAILHRWDLPDEAATCAIPGVGEAEAVPAFFIPIGHQVEVDGEVVAMPTGAVWNGEQPATWLPVLEFDFAVAQLSEDFLTANNGPIIQWLGRHVPYPIDNEPTRTKIDEARVRVQAFTKELDRITKWRDHGKNWKA